MTVDREILTIVQAAEYLQFHPDKVYRLVRSGELPASKIGKEWRIRRTDIEALLDRTANKGKTLRKQSTRSQGHV
jgi:excisionase family DNA binding protein